jgi:hypothetical protein
MNQLDIGDVTERLKGMSQCDGQGPAFKESQVRQAIEARASSSFSPVIGHTVRRCCGLRGVPGPSGMKVVWK